MFNDGAMIKKVESVSEKSSFQVPTKLSDLEPIFKFNFRCHPQGKNGKVSFTVELNDSLYENDINQNSAKTYFFNEEGVCSFSHYDLNNFFIEGDLKLINLNTDEKTIGDLTPANLRASITYGNSDDSLHYIKGNFKLLLNQN